MLNMRISTTGIKFIQGYEKCRLRAYNDGVGVITIGWGHTGNDVKLGQSITQEKADELFRLDLKRFEIAVNKRVKVPLTQGQYDALVSLSFNIGTGNFAKSTVLRKLNAKDYQGAGIAFDMWNKGGGAVMPGLQKRRHAEQALFNS